MWSKSKTRDCTNVLKMSLLSSLLYLSNFVIIIFWVFSLKENRNVMYKMRSKKYCYVIILSFNNIIYNKFLKFCYSRVSFNSCWIRKKQFKTIKKLSVVVLWAVLRPIVKAGPGPGITWPLVTAGPWPGSTWPPSSTFFTSAGGSGCKPKERKQIGPGRFGGVWRVPSYIHSSFR